MIKKIIGIIIILIVIGLGAAYLYRNAIVETAIEEATTYALKVDSDLGSASLGIMAGRLELNKYTIANPGGFQAQNLFSMDHGVLVLDAGSVFDKEIVVDTLILDGIRLDLEQIDMKNNVKQVLDNIGQMDFGSSSESDKTMKIRHVSVRNIGVNASASIMNKKQFEKSLTLENFTMNDVGGASGTTISGAIATVLKEVLARASTAGASQMGITIDTDKLKDEATQKIETEVKDQLKNLGGALKGK
ncbi:MAG: hypothetical protein R3F48_13095 [Candidatus Zixiibacteriota bacterium]